MTTILTVRLIGNKLQRVRSRKLISRTELGELTGLHPDHIARLERSESTRAHMPTIRKLVEALEVDPSEITEED